MQNQIRPIPAGEAAITTWGAAGLVGVAAFAGLMLLGDWTFLQAVFGASVVAAALGTLLALTVGRVKPADALGHEPPTRRASSPEGGLAVDLDAMTPRDLNKPSPHVSEVPRSMISDTDSKRGLNGPSLKQPIRGTIEAAPATIIPAPAPINATDPGVARPVGAVANPVSTQYPTPLNGRIVSPEPPLPLDGETQIRMSRNEAAMAAGADLSVRPSATHSAQSYNEPGDGSDTVVASGGSIAASAPAEPQAAASTEAAPAEGEKPMTLDAPRGGSGDDLKKIKGVGPKLEELLQSMGFWHFDQIARWSDTEVAWVDQNLEGFKGRVTRDEWVSQAKLLAEGGETEFSQKVDEGDVY